MAIGDLLASLTSGSNAVAISVGSSSVKFVELRKSGKSFQLTNFGVFPLPEDSVVNREIVNPVAVTEAIRQIVKQKKPSQKQVVTGLGGASVIIKRMTVEVPKVKDLQDAVFWEAEQYLPFDPSEVSMDYHMISRGKDHRTDVLFIASKISVMEGFTNAIQGGGLKIKIVDSEVLALQNIFEANYGLIPNEATALVDIGSAAIKVAVIDNGVPVYTKDSAFGGRNLTSDIQKNLNLSFEEAESMKTNFADGATPQEVVELMMVAAENFAVEIKRSLDFYNASSSGAPVNSVLLTGGSSKLPELSRIVEERVGIPAQILNPFARITSSMKGIPPELLQDAASLIAVPMGLAIRGTVK